ncbi:MAG: type II toxin-antitoxin system HicA family toxin [Pseudomonadota bacterium]
MSKAEKALDRLLRGTSDASFSFEDLRRVLLRLGFEQRTPKGSHYTFAHPAVPSILTIPKRKPLKPVYVRKARALITEYGLADYGSS